MSDGGVNDTAAVASGTTLGIVVLVLAIAYRCITCARQYRLSCVHSDGSFGCICREANAPNPMEQMANAHAEVVAQLRDDLKRAQDALLQQRLEEAQRRQEADTRTQQTTRILRRDLQHTVKRALRQTISSAKNATNDSSSNDSAPEQEPAVPAALVNTDSMQRLRMRMPPSSSGAYPSPQRLSHLRARTPLHTAPADKTRRSSAPVRRFTPPVTPTHRFGQNGVSLPAFESRDQQASQLASLKPELRVFIDEQIMLAEIKVQPLPSPTSIPEQQLSVPVPETVLSLPDINTSGDGSGAGDSIRSEGNETSCKPTDRGYEV
jgi:hypothetical protein